MRALIAIAALLICGLASATNFKYLDSPGRNITYSTVAPPSGAILILQYEGKEPTNKDRYFPFSCYSRNGKGPWYASDSNAGQNCLAVKKPATVAVMVPAKTVFSPASFWYQPIPKDVTLHANSAAMAKDFERQRKQFYNTVQVNTWQYASPVFLADESTPKQDVKYWNCQGKTWVDPVFTKMMVGVPIPANARPAAGSDAEMTVYDPKQDAIWEFWKARKGADGSWQACWGGKIENASKSQGVHRQWYGTTASGLPFQGGQITAEELKAGVINHVIGISMVQAAAAYGYPANRHDGQGGSPIFEGQRFRLDPSIDVDKLNILPSAKVIAKAAQVYGFVVWDKAGTVSIRAQGPASYPADPYPALFQNKPSYSWLNGIPWDRLQFLPGNYGKP